MKIKITKKDLLDLLQKVQSIIENRTTMPVLKNVLLRAQKDKLELFATNLEVSIRDSKSVEVLEPGEVVVGAKSFFDLIKEINDGLIILEKQKNNWLQITQGKCVFNLVGDDPKKYPLFPTFKNQNFMSVEKKVLIEMIEKTIFSISNDEKRFHLNGVFLEQNQEDDHVNFSMVSTDGHRLSRVARKLKNKSLGSNNQEGVIIPRKGLNEIKRLLESSLDNFEMAIEGSQLILKSNDTILMIRLIEGEFPNYAKLIPSNLKQSIFLDRKQFLLSLRRVSLLSNQKSKGVTLAFSKGKMEITSNNPELGDGKEELEIAYSGGNIKIGFNAKFILDVLTNIQEDEISLHLKDEVSPSLVQPKNNKDFTCVIMPMHI